MKAGSRSGRRRGGCLALEGSRGGEMADNAEWEAKVKGLLKGELKRRNVTYAQLVDKLAEIGVKETEPNVRNKLARGKFTAVFLIKCLEAIGARELRLD